MTQAPSSEPSPETFHHGPVWIMSSVFMLVFVSREDKIFSVIRLQVTRMSPLWAFPLAHSCLIYCPHTLGHTHTHTHGLNQYCSFWETDLLISTVWVQYAQIVSDGGVEWKHVGTTHFLILKSILTIWVTSFLLSSLLTLNMKLQLAAS